MKLTRSLKNQSEGNRGIHWWAGFRPVHGIHRGRTRRVLINFLALNRGCYRNHAQVNYFNEKMKSYIDRHQAQIRTFCFVLHDNSVSSYLYGFVIVLVLMPFSNKKSTIDLQRKGVYKVLLCILKRSCPRTFGLLFDLCSFVPKHLASQYTRLFFNIFRKLSKKKTQKIRKLSLFFLQNSEIFPENSIFRQLY